MTARARVEHNFIRNGANIWLGQTLGDGGTMLYRVVSINSVGEVIQDVVTTAPDTTISTMPSLILPDEIARALYEALGDYFGDTYVAGKTVENIHRKIESLAERVDVLQKLVKSLQEAVDKETGGR